MSKVCNVLEAGQGLPFPSNLPGGMEPLEGEPAFDPARHLALTQPEQILSLADLGYSEEEIAACPTSLGVTSAFRLLTPEGVAALEEVCRLLEPHTVSCGRIERMMRGGCYRSKFMRDLCLSEDVNEFLAQLCGTDVIPHTMPHQLGHLNFQPRDLSRHVDLWHHDTLGLDYVMMVTDPSEMKGGEFQYFLGTKQQAADFKARGEALPEERTVSARFPAAGYAVVQQGNMVVHRARRLEEYADRITMVNGYVFDAADLADPTDYYQLRTVDPQNAVHTEWLRHQAWRLRSKLDRLIEEAPFTEDCDALSRLMRESLEPAETLLADLANREEEELRHYG